MRGCGVGFTAVFRQGRNIVIVIGRHFGSFFFSFLFLRMKVN